MTYFRLSLDGGLYSIEVTGDAAFACEMLDRFWRFVLRIKGVEYPAKALPQVAAIETFVIAEECPVCYSKRREGRGFVAGGPCGAPWHDAPREGGR